MKELKPKERAILDYLKDKINRLGYPPSVRDICADLNIKSTSTAHMYLERLENKGYIQKESGKSRTIRIDDGSEDKKYQVPLLGQVAAGIPILTAENFEGYIGYSTRKTYAVDTLFALKVKGESMMNIGILDGDIVIVEQRNYAENGEIVVAMLEDEATVKRFFKENGEYRLQPENDKFEPIISNNVAILGKVVALIRYY